MSLRTQSGNDFSDPWRMLPFAQAVGKTNIYDDATVTLVDATTTAFFTEMANRGLQDTTNWTAATYKTILSISSGKGLVAGYIGCTAGGAETHTVEFTVDGVLTTITVTLASGQRMILLASGMLMINAFTTTNVYSYPGGAALDASKSWLTTPNQGNQIVPGWPWLHMAGVPLLRFNSSLLIRAKHSASITNSTATAYSGLMYRAGIAS